jgi:AcrR family transcriptional regulator
MPAYDEQRRRNGPGRPRHINKGRQERTPREEVLDAAARLFTEQGFANTSTREIADVVGIRQASLYYHFENGKADMLAEVLAKTIRPTLENVSRVEALVDDPERNGGPRPRVTALYLLVLLDVRTLVAAPHNSGLLGMLPDVAKEMPDFLATHAELADEYGRLGAAVASPSVTSTVGWRQLGRLLVQNVEMVIGWRTDKTYRGDSGDVLATSCLRICGVSEESIDAARTAAHRLLPEVVDDYDA